MDIENLSLSDALELIKRLKLEPYSKLSLPIAQAQLAEYYQLPDRFIYGRYERASDDYFLLSMGSRFTGPINSALTQFAKIVDFIGKSKYQNILKYLHQDYYISAGAILQYERKIYVPLQLKELKYLGRNSLIEEPFLGYLLSPENFKDITPINITPFNFYLHVKLVSIKDNTLMGMILSQDYQEIIKNADPNSITIPIRDWKDALILILNSQTRSFNNAKHYLSIFTDAKKNEEIKELTNDTKTLTMREVYDMIDQRDENLVYYSRAKVLEFIGAKNVSHLHRFETKNFYEFYDAIKRYLETDAGFTISTSPSNCKNQHDFYYAPYENYTFIYGPPIEGNCYSTNDLMGAFIVNNPEDYLFRRPDMPGSIFTYETVKQLYNMIQQQAPSIPNFQRETTPLIQKLTPVFSRPPAEMNAIKTLSDDDKDLFIFMMDALFQAGMYQRTWKGPGHPYIYQKSETGGSTLEAIECAMNPSFAYIAEDQEEMSEHGRKILKRLPAINKAYPLQPSTYRLWEFLELTTQGRFCIGFGSRIMIETAYAYLKILRIEIENFDYSRFEADSTHR